MSEYEKKLAKQARVAKALEKQGYAPHTARTMAEAGATAARTERKAKSSYVVINGRVIKT